MKKNVFLHRLAISSFASLIVVSGTLPLTGAAEKEKVAQESSESTLREPVTGFRVLPYLQSPTSTSMTISWVSELNEPGTVLVTGPGIKAKKVTSTPQYMTLMEYTDKELKQE